MTTPTPDEICERLDYIAAILEANAHKFTVPDHIPAKVKTLRFAKATIERLSAALEGACDVIRCSRHCAAHLDGDCDCGAQRIREEARAELGKDASDE